MTVTVSGQQNTDVTLGASTLTFSDTDWASPQSVTVTARDDADDTDDSVTLTHTAAGGEYTGVSPRTWRSPSPTTTGGSCCRCRR